MFVLLIQKDTANTALIRQALAQDTDGLLRLQCVECLPTALARIGGGEVDLVLLDLSRSRPAKAARWTRNSKLGQDHVQVFSMSRVRPRGAQS